MKSNSVYTVLFTLCLYFTSAVFKCILYQNGNGEVQTICDSDALYFFLLNFLKKSSIFRLQTCFDIKGFDFLVRKFRNGMLYALTSFVLNRRLFVKVWIKYKKHVQSTITLFPSVNWMEREAYDMLDINISNHPSLCKILSDYGFSGSPLQKDFPVVGTYDVSFSLDTGYIHTYSLQTAAV